MSLPRFIFGSKVIVTTSGQKAKAVVHSMHWSSDNDGEWLYTIVLDDGLFHAVHVNEYLLSPDNSEVTP